MSNNNDDILRSMMIFEGKETKREEPKKVEKKEEKLDEFKMKLTPASKKGMFKGKTKAEIRKELTSVKARMKSIEDSGKKVPKSLRTKFSELTFALRAKNDWGKAESKETTKKPMKESAGTKTFDVKVRYDDPSGKGIASQVYCIKMATDKAHAKSLAVSKAEKAGKKNVKAERVTEKVSESMAFETALDRMIAENFWGGEEDGSQDGGSSSMGSSEEGGESPLGNGHEHDSIEADSDEKEHDDVLKIDVPTFIKFLEFAREESTGDDELHELAEKLVQCCSEGETINMDKFEELCCMNKDGGDEVGANSEAGDEERESPSYGNEEGSGEDSGSGSGEEEKKETPWSVSESMRSLINRLY